MTTVFPQNAQVNSATPGTHALIIGVGAYPHLLGGTKDLVDDPMGLGQLSSPPVSAKAFCDWLLARQVNPGSPVGFNNPNGPLASVEMLLSPAGPYDVAPGVQAVVDVADKARIEQAFELWRQRIVANTASAGIFYFCGHGVMAATHHLLAGDFGDNPGNPWSKAFDLSLTVRALEREVSGPLYFFIDACRQIPKSFAAMLGATPLPLRPVQLNRAVVNTSRLVLQATGEGALAFALAGKVSRFTEALIRALSGYSGRKVPGAALWEVTGEELSRSVRRILDNGNKSFERRQALEQELIGSNAFHYETAWPRVMVNLDLLPPERRAAYRLYLESLKGQRHESDAAGCPWRIEVPSGFYDIGALPTQAAAVPLVQENEQLDPPHYEYQFSA